MAPLLKADPTEKLFGGVEETAVEKSQRFDRYKAKFNDMAWARVGNDGRTMAGNMRVVQDERLSDGQRLIKTERIEDATTQMRGLLAQDTINKALGADVMTSIEQSLAKMDIQKDISLTSPISDGLVLIDLKHPAEELVPIDTPFRNVFPRTQGVGTAFIFKQITGFSNAQTGTGLPLIHPGITDTTQTNFAVSGSSNALYYNRPPKISYTGQERTIGYFQFGLSDEVTWSAFFAGQGFQDPRALSQSSTMYASFLAEERMTVYGRGSSTGYSGNLTAPSAVAVTPSTTGGALPSGTTYFVAVAAVSGFGTTAATSSAAVTTTGSTGSIAVAWAPVVGATGYQVFVSSTANTPATEFYVGATGAYSGAYTSVTAVTTPGFTVVGPVPTTGATAPTTNTSAQAVGYDGIIPITTGASSGYTANIGGKFSTVNPGTEYQAAFATMYANNLANPDWIAINAQDRKQLSDLLKGSSSTGFRVNIDADGSGGHQIGQIVTAVQNESTGKVTDLVVHPYWPQGTSSIMTNSLPFPNSEVPSCWEYRNVQDYMGVNWPSMQLSYDFSTYWFGTFFCHAPAWQGSITGIQAG